MIRPLLALALATSALAGVRPAAALSLTDSWVQPAPDGSYLVSWRDAGPVDVYVSGDPKAAPEAMRLVSDNDADGRAQVQVGDLARPYFMLKSGATGETLRVAERLLPLQGASNFRDLGGYQARDGRRVKWGLLYRSGAMPSLTDADYAYLDKLGVKVVCDLRTVEEKQMAPTKWKTAREPRYASVDYDAQRMFGGEITAASATAGASQLYSRGPVMLKAQYKQIFDALLAQEVPLTFNCSAGQDRTGIGSALILSALGVPRHLIYSDYHLSTEYRRPDKERGEVDYAKYAPTNAMARLFLQYSRPGADRPTPLYAANGDSYLAATFAELDKTYGSVAGYLERELGVGPKEVERLKALYLE